MSGGDFALDALLGRFADRLAELSERAGSSLDEAPALLKEVLATLSLSLEELHVTAEEMHQQAEQIEAVAARVEMERRRYAELFELAPDGYLVTDAHGVIVEANRSTSILLEYTLASLVGKPLAAVVASNSQSVMFRALRELVAGSGFADVEVELTRRRSEPLATWMRGAGSPDADGTVRTVRWVIRDVSERNAVRALLERANREKDAFLLALSHDLRSPVSAISGFLEVLGDDPGHLPAADREAAFEAMRDSAHSIETVIANLLDVDRLGRGSVHLIRRTTDLVELVTHCICEDGLQGRVTLDLVPVTAQIDPGLTERILHNLLANAARYSPAETEIGIRVRSTSEGTQIEVHDEGPGVPDDAKEAVFELFYQIEEGSGRGVGLYLVRQFAELHDGRAWIEDRPNGGASVRVLLPG